MFLLAGSVNAAAYCKVGTKTYNPGTYTFSNGKWICQTDGEWKKVQTQSYKCRVGTTYYNPGTHGFASGVWICQTNGKWTKAQNQPSTWTCYNGFTCYKKNGKTYATKSGTTWYYSNGKWYKDTKLTVQWSASDKDEVTVTLKATRNGVSGREPVYKIYWTGVKNSYLPIGVTPKQLTYKNTGMNYLWVGGQNEQGCYVGLYVDTQFNTKVFHTTCRMTKEAANTYRIDF